MGIGYKELIWLFLIILLLFGAKNLPRLAQSIGLSIREFKKGIDGLGQDLKETVDADREAVKPAAPKPAEHAQAREMPPAEDSKEVL